MVAWNTNSASRIAILAARTPMAKAGTALREVHASELRGWRCRKHSIAPIARPRRWMK